MFSRYKLLVADAVVAHFSPIRTQILDYMNNPDYLIAVMAKGAEKARAVAEKTIDEVKLKVGFRWIEAFDHNIELLLVFK